MEQNPLVEVVTSIAIMATTLVVAHYADKAVIAGIKKARPALKIPKFSVKVKPA